MTRLRQAIDQLLGGRLEPLLELLAEDVRFEVESGGDVPGHRMGSGRQAVMDYFTALGALVAFWQIDYSWVDGRVIAWGKERFRIQGCGLEGECEFALVFDLSEGGIERLLVIEDLTSGHRILDAPKKALLPIPATMARPVRNWTNLTLRRL